MDPARRVAYETLAAVHRDDGYANLVLPRLIADHRLTGRDAAFATELTYGTLRQTGSLDAVARVQAGILARAHARSAARAVGPTNPLAELSDPEAFCQRVLCFALGYADVAQRDHARFVGARAELERVERWAGG